MSEHEACEDSFIFEVFSILQIFVPRTCIATASRTTAPPPRRGILISNSCTRSLIVSLLFVFLIFFLCLLIVNGIYDSGVQHCRRVRTLVGDPSIRSEARRRSRVSGRLGVFRFFIIFLSFFLLVLIKSRIGYRYGETQPGSLDVDACTSDRDGCSATTEAFRHVEARAPQPPPPPRDRRYAWRPFAEPRAARRSAPRDSPTVAESGRAQRFRIT